jgi:endogenous inhibitor of DNA gyrase (YacG/DUF329 family)
MADSSQFQTIWVSCSAICAIIQLGRWSSGSLRCAEWSAGDNSPAHVNA